jgi:hypothetical protein
MGRTTLADGKSRRTRRPTSHIRGLGLSLVGAAGIVGFPLGSSAALAAGSQGVAASALVNQACSVTLSAAAFQGRGHLSDGGSAMNVDFYFGSAGDLLSFTQRKDQTVSVITHELSIYLKGNQPFWQASTKNTKATALLANRWIDMTSDRKDASSIIKGLNKRTLLQDCRGNRSAVFAGHATVNGVKASKVHENSDQESDTYYIEEGSTPYILKVEASPSGKTSGEILFSDYGVQPVTTVPPGAIPISQLLQ